MEDEVAVVVHGSATGRGRVPVAGGRSVLAAAETATGWLATHRDAIDAMNVFPVPDGDTGTNMLLTMRAAVEEGRLSEAEGAGAGEVAARIARGALMGARGNSGVILSQVIRGFAEAIADRTEIDGRDLARGLAGARDLAYKAVLRPVEGTMLTVVRVAAERAEAAAVRSAALPTILSAAARGARQALATTPNLLEILRQAGVVDAGGQGIVHLLEGMERYARGGRQRFGLIGGRDHVGDEVHAVATPAVLARDAADALHHGVAYGYCTNFVVLGDRIDVDLARAELAAMGDSAVIVGDGQVLKVHLHTGDPGRALVYAARLGELDQIKIDNMTIQTRALGGRGGGVSVGAAVAEAGGGLVPASPPGLSAPAGTVAVIAVAAGEGLAAALRSMGAAAIVGGGQTMNPSTEELLAAVEAVAAPAAILLPNNPNIVLTANQVPGLASKPVGVVPSRSVPQGLAALVAFDADDGLEANLAKMTPSMAGVRTVEVTRAVRDATIDGVRTTRGQAIGLFDDRLVTAGEEPIAVAAAALAAADLAAAELVTVFLGGDATAEQGTALRTLLLADHPGLRVEIHDGGQPHYLFVIAVD